MFSLLELYGKRVKVSYDPSLAFEKEPTAEDYLWLQEIKCKRGLVYPQTDTEVAVEVSSRLGASILKLLKDKAVKIRECDEGYTIKISVSLLPVLFKFLKPTRIRALSDAQKQVVNARLKGKKLPEAMG